MQKKIYINQCVIDGQARGIGRQYILCPYFCPPKGSCLSPSVRWGPTPWPPPTCSKAVRMMVATGENAHRPQCGRASSDIIVGVVPIVVANAILRRTLTPTMAQAIRRASIARRMSEIPFETAGNNPYCHAVPTRPLSGPLSTRPFAMTSTMSANLL